MQALTDHIERALAAGMGTAAQVVVATRDEVLHSSAHGVLVPGGAPITTHTTFDIASLTKVFTATLAMVYVDRGLLDLDAPVGHVLPDVAWPEVTARELLAHRSGLPAWKPWFAASRTDVHTAGLWPEADGGTDMARAAQLTWKACTQTPRLADRARCYSDLGFITLGKLLEGIGGASLDVLAQRHVCAPLDLAARYRPGLPSPVTGTTRPRPPLDWQASMYTVRPQKPQVHLQDVDDDNAWALGGVAGHAGVFASAADVATLGRAWLADLHGAARLVSRQTARDFVAVDAPDLQPIRSLGLDRVTPGGSTGTRFGHGPQGGVGHLGFVGTSVWLDLDREAVVVLLTNRVFPERGEVAAIRALRVAVHEAVVDLLGG